MDNTEGGRVCCRRKTILLEQLAAWCKKTQFYSKNTADFKITRTAADTEKPGKPSRHFKNLERTQQTQQKMKRTQEAQ